ncbi:hypothetical protein B0T26DRAFT_760841, partial [Lasiosphaeria miniovina]
MTADLGSHSWIGAEAYEPGSEFHERATAFLAAVKWDLLASISSRLRNRIPCHVHAQFSIGHFNMIRRIEFADGASWVARLRLPPLEALSGGNREVDAANTLMVEIASMKFLKAKTSTPFPEVHSCSRSPFLLRDPANDVGAPYILMGYMDGTAAAELLAAKECELGLYDTPDQDRKFRKDMAAIQATLSSFAFDRIGSLYQDEHTSEFFIGADIETSKGGPGRRPSTTAPTSRTTPSECARAAARRPTSRRAPRSRFQSLFKHLIARYAEESTEGPFRLTNRDFGAHNLLVNNDFEIVGVIDLDGVMAAPVELVAQYPVLTGLDREPPGHVETKPAAISRIARTGPRLEEYRDLVGVAGAEIVGGGEEAPKEEAANASPPLPPPLIASRLFSDAPSIVQGVLQYRSHQKFVNDKWMEGYLRLLR